MIGAGLLLTGALAAAAPPPSASPSVILITLDTTRSDYVGRREGGVPVTPNLDALARSGMRFTRAVTASPLTLPAHCTLLTGLDPPAHGVRDNGVASLPDSVPTLGTAFSARGYQTAAFVASRVLDRRFGLARGFQVYDDAMVAEKVGERGYPERDAATVTTAALAWASRLPAGEPYFLWVHYYDAHSPYEPPGIPRTAPALQRYAGEIRYVDSEIGRLLEGLPRSPGGRLVAAVGDHGEMLGEHGEKTHGIFLYRAAVEVPLILAGPGVAPGKTIAATAGTRGLAASLLALAGPTAGAEPFGPGLPGLAPAPPAAPVYSETLLPATAYGWSPLEAATDDRRRLIVAPRPELYDLASDPGETQNLFSEQREAAARLGRFVARTEKQARAPAPVPADRSEMAASLRQLGYLSGSSPRAGTIDPKDGIRMLDEFEAAAAALRRGQSREAAEKLRELVRRSPGNVPFLARLGEAEVASGQTEAGIATFREAIALNPGLDFLHEHLARLYLGLGRIEEARASYRTAVELNPRMAPAWLGLARIASRTGPPGEESRVLRQAEAAGTNSAAVMARLAQIELSDGKLPEARRHAEEAIRLAPEVAAAWWVAGEAAEKEGHTDQALERYERALALGLEDPRALVRTSQLLIAAGRVDAARPYLRRAIVVGAGSPSAEDARRLLQEQP
jgi:arylsulfatase A-like enzyme/Tfp pilus assembly protein PilF